MFSKGTEKKPSSSSSNPNIKAGGGGGTTTRIAKDLSLLSLNKRGSLRNAADLSNASSFESSMVEHNSAVHGDAFPAEENSRECCHTLIIVFPTLEEFEQERGILRNSVLPELQQFCCELGVDLDCCTLFETEDVLFNIEQYTLLLDVHNRPNVSVMCFVGDKYGNGILPLELTQDDFNAIRETALESSVDVSLLSVFYAMNKQKDPPRYTLRPVSNAKDAESAKKLCETIQNCSRSATKTHQKAAAQISQTNNDERQQQTVFKSLIELMVDETLSSVSCSGTVDAQQRHVVVSRKFLNAPSSLNDRWMDFAADKQANLAALKNKIEESTIARRVGESPTHLLPFCLDLHGSEPQIWIKSKEGMSYEQKLLSSLVDSMKSILAQIYSYLIVQGYQTVGPVSQMQVAHKENRVHISFYDQIASNNWVNRTTKFDDSNFSRIVDRLISPPQNGPVFIQIHGPTGSGKTSALCHFFKLLKANTDKCHVLIRFAHLTDSSIFANELLKDVFLLMVCDLAGFDSEKVFPVPDFRLNAFLKHMRMFFEQLDRPVILLIDDIHLLRAGRVLGKMDEEYLRKYCPQLSIVCTSSIVGQSLVFSTAELLELPPPNLDESFDIFKQLVTTTTQKRGKKLGSSSTNFLSGVFQGALKASQNNLILGRIQFAELVDGHTEVSQSVEARLQRIELCCGAENVRVVCEFICCAPCGITAQELTDAFRLRKFTTAMSFEPEDVLSVSPFIVLRHLGEMLSSFVMDRRRIWTFRHASVAQIIRQRYLQSTGEIKLVNEIMGAVLRGPSDEDGSAAATAMLFPQPMIRENGTVNVRRIRFHWYYLLLSGNMETLKTLTLCSFDYLEAVFRSCGLARLLSIFEECLLQVLDHDLLVIFEQVLLPAVETLTRDPRQFVSEFLNRMRYTRAKNGVHLNNIVEQAMQWTDNYNSSSLLVPLTCWISPPKMKQVLSFVLPQWKPLRTLIHPTRNHQHLLVAGNENAPGSIYMFHLASQLLIRTFPGHEGSTVTALCTSNDSQFFISTGLDGTIKLWNFTQLDSLKTLHPKKARILCALIGSSDQWIAIGSSDSSARLVNIESGEVTHNFRDHTGPVVCLQLSSDNTLLITGSGEFVVMVWNIETSSVLVKLGGLMAPVTCLAITSNDTFLAVACEDETLRVFGLVSAQDLHELAGHDSRVNALVTSADDCQLFAATRGKVFVFDIHNGQLLDTLQCASHHPVTSIMVSDDNSFVILACGDTVHIWNNWIERENPDEQVENSLTCVQISPDEKGAACGTVDGILAFWDLDVCQCLWTTVQQKSGAVMALCFTPDSFYLLSGSAQGPISLWETSNGKLIRQMPIHTDLVTAICCFSDGVRVASCDHSGSAHVWLWSEDHKRVEVLVTIPHMSGPVHVRLNDSLLIGQNATNPKEMNIWLLQADSRPSGRAKVHHNEAIVCYSVNKVGTVLVTGSTDLSLKVWQLDSGGLLIQVLVGQENVPTCCCVSEDGRLVASGGRDKNLIIWDVTTGSVHRMFRNIAIPKVVELSQDGTVVVTGNRVGSEDSWIEAIHTETGRLLSSFNTHRQRLVMGADGDRILLQLGKTPQLPIICLHNSPANLSPATANRYGSISEQLIGGASPLPSLPIGDVDVPPLAGSVNEARPGDAEAHQPAAEAGAAVPAPPAPAPFAEQAPPQQRHFLPPSTVVPNSSHKTAAAKNTTKWRRNEATSVATTMSNSLTRTAVMEDSHHEHSRSGISDSGSKQRQPKRFGRSRGAKSNLCSVL